MPKWVMPVIISLAVAIFIMVAGIIVIAVESVPTEEQRATNRVLRMYKSRQIMVDSMTFHSGNGLCWSVIGAGNATGMSPAPIERCNHE